MDDFVWYCVMFGFVCDVCLMCDEVKVVFKCVVCVVYFDVVGCVVKFCEVVVV